MLKQDISLGQKFTFKYTINREARASPIVKPYSEIPFIYQQYIGILTFS